MTNAECIQSTETSSEHTINCLIIVIILTTTRICMKIFFIESKQWYSTLNCTCQIQGRMNTASMVEYTFYLHIYCYIVFSMQDASGLEMCRTRLQVCTHLSVSNQNERTQVSSSHSSFRRTVT